jgi:hypothetical protein
VRIRQKRQALVEKPENYPELAADLETLDRVLVGRFHELDEAALSSQNRFLRGQVVLIAGSAVSASAGAVQTALGGGVLELGVGQAVFASMLTVLAARVARGRARGEYIDQRLRAERLRAHYFLYLARAAPYEGSDRASRLEHEVNALGTTRG